MLNYYFLATSLPKLHIAVPPEIDFYELEDLLHENLLKEDRAKLAVMRRYYDLENIRAFWLGSDHDPFGALSKLEIEESLLDQVVLPDYVFEFINKYDNKESRLDHFPELISFYFAKEVDHVGGFLKNYLEFEREWRLVFTGFRAKMLGWDLAQELQYEDPRDELIAQMMAQRDAKMYEPPTRYEDLKPLFEEHYDTPMELHQALCEYRFARVADFLGVDVFSIDRILGYFAQYVIVQRWLELDKKQGLEVVDNILKGTS